MSSDLDIAAAVSGSAAKGTSKPVIDNEILSYRAIHPMAVAALGTGLLSIFSFAYGFFYVFSFLAILFGFLAVRKIGELSDIYTGQTMAKFGAALGLICGLFSLTNEQVTNFRVKASARQFTTNFSEVLNHQTLEDAMWFRVEPSNREGMDRKTFFDNLREQAAKDASVMESMGGPILMAKRWIKRYGDVSYDGMENFGFDQDTPYAHVRVKLGPIVDAHAGHSHDGPDAAKGEEKKGEEKKGDAKAEAAKDDESEFTNESPLGQKYGLLILRGRAKNWSYTWYVQQLEIPYQPGSKQVVATPDHGHDHG